MKTGFFWDETCFWHGGGNYAQMLPVGGLVQPMDGGLPESPETKRRLKNLITVTGLADDLVLQGAAPATQADLLRVHPAAYLDKFKALSDAGGGEIGLRAPFGAGGYQIAAQSAGLTKAALLAVLEGQLANAYALSRPPGHHCLPDWPNGFCLLNNIAIAIEAAKAVGVGQRFAVLDWDVHHGNGTEAVFYDRADVLTVSIHQDRNYPLDTGRTDDRGRGAGEGFNLNIPLPAGTGQKGYLAAMERLALPAISAFAPDVLIIACGYDAAANDPLGRMLATAETFGLMTRQVLDLADEVCGGKLMMTHEGGYSETYVPFCGHRVLEVMSGSTCHAHDPFAEAFAARQPDPRFDAYLDEIMSEIAGRL
ncbi:class II histone deacetylase [Yoonia sediminilitoris]|uniref:Acetoin utilization deacetylase AcuC-like enzyme n=1 Tax=Yoonia sediminilitoris TaxID=1286148 RepID=A0A2T6KBB1_9RHOB|nr:class II histone deacetylase [Yoonia sediminilitoris]PUB12166.1 acetoin utilization deacetylase AcuC-like enzyme [Yoonia sediminilitoris]RCW92993.1 acetoin utilization deacetylase AcuC-like enzyme [Yoonia sediminilitoris]